MNNPEPDFNPKAAAIKQALQSEISRLNTNVVPNHRLRLCLRDIITDRDFSKFIKPICMLAEYGKLKMHEESSDPFIVYIELIPEND